MEKKPKELYDERLKRFEDAIHLKVPDRVPITGTFSLFPAKYMGMTCEEVCYDAAKMREAFKKTIIDFEMDIYKGPRIGVITPGGALEALDCVQAKWPGHGISADHTHQFVEGEYMKADEYDAFLDDPSDFAIRSFLPRIFRALEGFKKLPPLKAMLFGYTQASLTQILTLDPEVASSFDALFKAAREAAKWQSELRTFDKEMAELGFPSLSDVFVLAPFDLIGDQLRGMHGSMLDMYRQPDKLILATEKVLPMMVDLAVSNAQISGNPRIFIPLHRGADGFMSPKQFETFYWPGLKKLILALIDRDLTPLIFFEGCFTQKLRYLNELPKGKIVAFLDTTDMIKAKEIIGDTVCISGNMPASLLQIGTPEQVKEYTKKLIDVCGKGGGFIMCTRGVLDETNPELVKLWIDFTKEYGVYR